MKYLLIIVFISIGYKNLWAKSNGDNNIFIYQKPKLQVSRYIELNCLLYSKEQTCMQYQFVSVVDDKLHVNKELIGSSFSDKEREQIVQNYAALIKNQLKGEGDIFISATYGLVSQAYDYPVFLPFAIIAGTMADLFKLPYSVGEYFRISIPLRKTVRRLNKWSKSGQIEATKISPEYYLTVIDFIINATKKRSI
jgi:hypothetical protein